MRDKRPVDELSIEELERVLAIKKREARQEQLKRMKRSGRVIESANGKQPTPEKVTATAASQAAPPQMGNKLPAATVQISPESVQKKAIVPQFEADVPPEEYTGKRRRGDAWRKFVNRSLLSVEVIAVLVLVGLGVVMFADITQLQEETARAQALAEEQRRAALPTLEPTPQLQLASIVLPGGHTPPTEPGGGQFNFDEIPQHLRPLLRDQIFLPPEIERPPATEETPLRLIIPKLDVDQTIVQGVDWEALKLGIGQVLNGATPSDQNANVVLAAHNDIYGEIFRHLDELEAGDQFQIQTMSKVYTYTITGWEIVEPSAVHVMESRGRPTATLISCYPYQVNNKRIVVFAERSDNLSPGA